MTESIQYSFIMPMYQAESTISLVLKRLVETLPQNSEIIIVDDGSTDRSMDLVNEFIVQSAPISLLSQEHKGPSAARNLGVKHAQGEWFIFVDSDVEVLPNAIEILLANLKASPQLLGANALPSRHLPYHNWGSKYTNESLIFQLQSHGQLVNTCFTSLCILNRKGWQILGGWDESQNSRYVDDVQSRWALPPQSLIQVFDANFIHHKEVYFPGLFKHRFNVGFHFINSPPKTPQSQKPSKDSTISQNAPSWKNWIIHHRYPSNTLLAAMTPFFIWLPYGLLMVILPLFIVNFGFFQYIRQYESNMWKCISIFPLSLLEGFSFGFGIFFGLWSKIWNKKKSIGSSIP